MAGIYFKLEKTNDQYGATLTGYFRLRGEVDVLGIISASIELYLEMRYESATGKVVRQGDAHHRGQRALFQRQRQHHLRAQVRRIGRGPDLCRSDGALHRPGVGLYGTVGHLLRGLCLTHRQLESEEE